jgi:dolichol kinase
MVHTRVVFRSRAAAHCSEAHDPETSTFAMTELELLKKPEYIHVVLNHLPIYGTMLGALALAISLILRSRAAQITALILTLIAGASAYPVFVTGQRAYKTIRNQSDDAGADWLDEHMDRAEKTIGVFYFLAALAIAGLLVPIKWPKSAFPLAALILVVAILCSGIAVYIAQPGGRVRHPEFRTSDTPDPSTEMHRDK